MSQGIGYGTACIYAGSVCDMKTNKEKMRDPAVRSAVEQQLIDQAKGSKYEIALRSRIPAVLDEMAGIKPRSSNWTLRRAVHQAILDRRRQ